MTKIKYLFLAFQFLTALSCYSQLVNLTNGKLVYTKHANKGETNNDNVIPDFSMCGYGGGGVALPVGIVPVKETLTAPASGTSRAMIQDAIDRVSVLPLDSNGFRGAILLKAGTYYLNDDKYETYTDINGNVFTNALVISASGVVLRGEGQGTSGTVLISSLERKHTIINVKPKNDPTLQTINFTNITDSYVGTGAKSFNVEIPSNFKVGDLITLRFTPNAQWLTDIKVNTYLNAGAGDLLWDTTTYIVKFERKITAINGSTITIDAPVVMPMQTKYGLGQIGKLTVTGRLSNVGVEDLRLQGPGVTPTCASTATNRLEHGVKVWFGENYWVHGVTTVHSRYSCVSTWGSKFVTVEDCAYVQPYGPKDGGYRYSFNLDANSQFVLFQRCYANDGRHDFVTHARIPGPNAYVDCLSLKGSTEGPHERWAMGTLYDNCKMETQLAVSENRGASGSGHGWAGITQLAWNTVSPYFTCDTPLGFQNYIIGGTGTEVLSGYINHNQLGVYTGYYESIGTPITHTRSLYLKQLEDRLGSGAVSNITIPEQRTGNIYTKLATWAGNGSLVTIPVTGITLSPVSLTVSIGSSQQLAATIAPGNASNKNITWTSNNAAVAVSATGMVTAVSDGTAIITATTEDGGKTATTTITTSSQVFVSSITVSPTTATIAMGNQQQLTATILPANASNRNITWISSNTNVATVNLLGLVTSVAAGTCTITVTTQDGNKNAISVITVNPYPVSKIISTCDSNSGWTPASTVTVNSTDKKEGTACLQSAGSIGVTTNDFIKVFSPPINTGSTIANGKLQFWYFVSDINAHGTANQVELGSGGAADTNEFNWNIGTLQTGWNLVTLPFSTAGITGGTPDLSAINWFRIYRTKTASVTTKIDQIIIVDGALSTDSNILLSGVRVFPNPLKEDKLTIKVDGANTSEIFKVTISNIQGQVVYQTNFSGKNFIEINTAGLLKSAVYLVSVQSGQKISTTKLIVQ